MKIRERQLAYAFALVENAKNTLYTAMQVIGNTLRYGKDGDIRDEILGAAKTLENARLSHAKSRLRMGKMYCPMFHVRLPEWAAVGDVFDYRSPWLAENLTPSQRAFARELAIERRNHARTEYR